jgi:putative DNA primase/helicase
VADVTDSAGELVTVHVTYLEHGQKLEARAPRKLLGPLTGREGCAVRLMPAGDVLGVAEGIETALSAAAIDGVPVWAAINASLLAKFEPPPGVKTLRIYADRDEAGLAAACRLMERLQSRVQLQVRIPTAPANDWNDQLVRRDSGKGSEP